MYEELIKYRDKLYTCNRSHCGFCQEGCLPYKLLGYEQYSSRGRMILSRVLIERNIKIDENIVDIVFNCFLCGFCNAKCALYPTDIFTALRREINKAGLTPRPLIEVANNIVSSGNPYAFSREDRYKWTKDIQITTKSQSIYFPGCVYPYLQAKQTKTIYSLLAKTGIEISYIPEIDNCCGYPVYLTGDMEKFEAIAKKNYENWKRQGIKKIYTPCPGCYKTLAEIYPEFIENYDIEVYHAVLAIHDAYENGKIRLQKKYQTITYHDPCDLTRFMRVIEEPRKLIEAISNEFIELDYHGYFAKCCGGGGLVVAYNPQLHLQASIHRAKEIESVGAEIVTTFCPTCLRTLRKGLKRIKAKTKLIDLGQLIFSSMQ